MKFPLFRYHLFALILLAAVVEKSSAQLIHDLHHEPFRDKVLITYNLNGLADHQRMDVTVFCSDDNFAKPLASLRGNGVGETVTRNGQKTIIWDVLTERKSLVGPIEFELRYMVMDDFIERGVSTEAVSHVALSIDEKKSVLYADMSSTLGDFIIKAKDLVIAFRKTNTTIFEDNVALRNLTNSVINYNTVFTKLNSDRMSYEKQVLLYWNNEALYNDVRYLFDYALGELHSVNVLELNGSLNTINDINLGKIAGRKNQKEAKENLMASIVVNTNQLEKRIQELERRANRILYTLSNR